jgi:alanyl-tRNA synthetase
LVEGKSVDAIGPHTKAEIVLDTTPFYAESGGQVGDQGLLIQPDTGLLVGSVDSVYKPAAGLFAHRILSADAIHVGDLIDTQVLESARRATMRNHTATHLLHAALRQVLGTHVKQAGSVVDPTRLRFDFSHYTQVTAEELLEIERLVNDEVFRNTAVTTDVMDIDSAIKLGAMALFGEKYGERVRVVSIPDFSRELCGGTHVSRTGDIGLIKVTGESSISAGVRRLEAVTGEGALKRFQETSGLIQRVAASMKTSESELAEQLEKSQVAQKAIERELEQLKEKFAQSQLGELSSRAIKVNGAHLIVSRVDGLDRAQMRTLADALRNKLSSAVVALASPSADQVALLVAVSKDLTTKVAAGKLVGSMAAVVGGKGGGRPDLAEAGGKDVAKIDEALAFAKQTVEQALA